MYIVAGYPQPNITLLQNNEPLKLRKGKYYTYSILFDRMI